MDNTDLVNLSLSNVTDKTAVKLLGKVGNQIGFGSPEDLLDYNKIAGYAGGYRNEWQANSFCIRWKLDDYAKAIEIGGYAALYDAFLQWVASASVPCEIKKDGTDFSYLNTSNYSLRSDGSASKISNTGYLQMSEISNINVGFYLNGATREMEVWFNMQTACPTGMHPMNASGKKKLWARYDTTFNDDGTTVNSCKGTSQPSGSWSMDLLLSRNKATKSDLLEITAWEYICMCYIFAAYYKTFNIANTELGEGLTSGSESVARGFVNGSTDTLTTPNGKISSGAYRFMYLENIFSGKQWLECCGWRGENGISYLTYNDVTANISATMNTASADYTGSYLTNMSGTFVKNIGSMTEPQETGGSTTTGFCDGNWTDTGGSRIFLAGGSSGSGSCCGPFARAFNRVAADSGWTLRGRCALNR